MFSNEIYSIHGDPNTVLVASVCDKDRQIVDKYLTERADYENSREFRQYDRDMRSNKGVRL